jgi:hypothetical protein
MITEAELIPLLTPEDEEEMINEVTGLITDFAFTQHGFFFRCCNLLLQAG